MESRPDKKNKTTYVGLGISIGAAIGFIFGIILFDEMIYGAGIGVALGLIAGAAIDAQAKN